MGFMRMRKILKKTLKTVTNQQQAEQKEVLAETAPAVFESQASTPASSTGNTAGAQVAEESSGLLGNVRKTLFSGGVSSGGGVFSYGKRKKSSLFGFFNEE